MAVAVIIVSLPCLQNLKSQRNDIKKCVLFDVVERAARPPVTFAYFLINLINNLLPHLLFQLHICNEEGIWGKDPIKRTQLKPINN